ncbi:hypothetical protein [Chitinophaga sp.]|uniref:hypothetical protein n=1 Tax=Chitinophaga sp. TaxID=1869181 RepID=UPI0031CF32C5
MAIANKNLFLAKLSGSIGNQMTVRVRRENTVLGKKVGAYSLPPNEQQSAVRDRFSMAAGYAQSILADAAKKALYQAAADSSKVGASAYNLALKDAFDAPEIKEVQTTKYKGNIGDPLSIDVRDVVDAASVVVSIVKADGTLVETGNAVKQRKWRWQYTATAANDAVAGSIINVVATDLADNETIVDFEA